MMTRLNMKDEERVEEIYGGKIKEVRNESDNEDNREQGEPGLERDARKAKRNEARREELERKEKDKEAKEQGM